MTVAAALVLRIGRGWSCGLELDTGHLVKTRDRPDDQSRDLSKGWLSQGGGKRADSNGWEKGRDGPCDKWSAKTTGKD